MTTARTGLKGTQPSVLVQKAKPRLTAHLNETPKQGELALGFHEPTCALTTGKANPEKAKYEQMWQNPDYRKVSPGEAIAIEFLRQARPSSEAEVLDLGCGTGRGGLAVAVFGGCKVCFVDFAANCLDEDVRNALTTQAHKLRFVEADLEKPLPVQAEYGFCTDVMEHIPTDKVDAVLDNILRSARHVFFQISLLDDHYGKTIGEVLHLTVKPFEWWQAKLRERDVVFHWSHNTGGTALFYVTAWIDAPELVKRGRVNTTDDAVKTHILSALQRKLPTAVPHQRQDTEIMILGGGPSLNEFWDDIATKRAAGMPLVTTNGVYNEVIKRGMKPSAQVIVDARAFNSRFVVPHIDTCKYFLSSQCAPTVFDAAPAEQTILWHSVINEQLADFIDEHAGAGTWFPVPGGSTVMLRTFTLMRMLGYWRFHVYGFDSCLADKAHHAYEQRENDYEKAVPVSVGGRVFMCHVWMASQAQEFIDQVKMMGDEVKMIVYGDGLIAHILKTGAQMLDLDEQATLT